MKKYILFSITGMCFLAVGCAAGFLGKTVKGDDKSVKKTQIAGAIIEEVKITGIKKADLKLKVRLKADVKATGADLSKKEVIGGDKIITNDSKMIIYIFGSIIGLMSTIFTGLMAFMGLLIRKMFIQLGKKDKIILDLGNDAKEILLRILPATQDTIHRAYENGLKALEGKKK